MSNELQANENRHVINSFMNYIHECLYEVKNFGYDTANLYSIYDTIRANLMNEEYVNNLDTDTIDDIKKYSEVLSKLLEMIKNNKSLYYQSFSSMNYNNLEIENKENKKPKYMDFCSSRGISEDIKKISAVILSAASIFLGAKAGTLLYKGMISYPEVTEVNLDSLGNKTTQNYFGASSSELNIIEYSKADNSGFRMKKTYFLNPNINVILDADTLFDIDLSGLTPKEELVYDEEINRLTTDTYRTYTHISINKDKKGISKNTSTFDKSMTVILGICTFIVVCMITNLIIIAFYTETLNSDYTDYFSEFFEYIKELMKYKQELKENYKKMNLAKKDKEKYETIILGLCNELDKSINSFVDALSMHEMLREKQLIDKAKEKEEENILTENEKKNILDNYISIIISLEKELLKYRNEDRKGILHTIPISEALLFESKDDHLIIRKELLKYLKYFNLSLINFTNVDCTNIDFSETNATINPQTVYNKDISNSKFNNRNIPDWSDYNGVNISGTKLEENPSTMLNISESIRDDSTQIKLIKKPYSI